MAKKLFVIAGHGAGDPGACSNGYQEAAQVRKLAKRIKALGGSQVKLASSARNYYADNGITKLKLDPKKWEIVELHMDSGPASAKGGHVIICSPLSADAIDKKLAAGIRKFFPGRAESIVKRANLANPKRAKARGYSYRLVENGFISNKGDAQKFDKQIDDLARIYLDAFGIKHK